MERLRFLFHLFWLNRPGQWEFRNSRQGHKNSFRQTIVFQQTNSARRQSGPQDLLITDYIFLASDFRLIERPINPHEPDF